MNITTRKKLLLTHSIIQITVAVLYVVSSVFLFVNINYLKDAATLFGYSFNEKYIIIRYSINLALYTIYTIFMEIYLHKKRKQEKEVFLSKMLLLKIISYVDILLNGPLCILLFFAAYKKDDNKPAIVKPVKEKKQKKVKTSYSKETKQKLHEEKIKKRKGLISQELYEKNVKKIIKAEKQKENEKNENN